MRRHRIGGVSIAYSPDGKRLASADGPVKVVHVWDTATGANMITLGTHTNWAWCASFQPRRQVASERVAEKETDRLAARSLAS